MRQTKRRFIVLIVTTLIGFSQLGAERVYENPVKPGENPAAVAQPRNDWYATVQSCFDKYSGKPFPIIFDGDSITNRWQTTGKKVWNADFVKDAADFGIEGDRTENLLWRLNKGQVDGMDPKVVVLMIGTNNTGRDSVDEIAGGVLMVVQQYMKRCPHAHIILMAIFPRSPKATDGARKKVAAINVKLSKIHDPRVSYVDIGPQLIQPDGTITQQTMPDFVHPTQHGYEIWATAIQPIIRRYIKGQ